MFSTLGLLLMLAVPTDSPTSEREAAAPRIEAAPERDLDVSRIRSRDFRMPFRIDPAEVEKIASVTLYVSTNRGSTWTEVMTVLPDAKDLEYHAKADGIYWFAVQVKRVDGGKEPAQMNRDVPPQRKVQVDTTPEQKWAAMKPAD